MSGLGVENKDKTIPIWSKRAPSVWMGLLMVSTPIFNSFSRRFPLLSFQFGSAFKFSFDPHPGSYHDAQILLPRLPNNPVMAALWLRGCLLIFVMLAMVCPSSTETSSTIRVSACTDQCRAARLRLSFTSWYSDEPLPALEIYLSPLVVSAIAAVVFLLFTFLHLCSQARFRHSRVKTPFESTCSVSNNEVRGITCVYWVG